MFFLCVCVAEDPANRAREEKKRFRSRQTTGKQGTNHTVLSGAEERLAEERLAEERPGWNFI